VGSVRSLSIKKGGPPKIEQIVTIRTVQYQAKGRKRKTIGRGKKWKRPSGSFSKDATPLKSKKFESLGTYWGKGKTRGNARKGKS